MMKWKFGDSCTSERLKHQTTDEGALILYQPPPPQGGRTVIWPMNNQKSIGNHRRRRC